MTDDRFDDYVDEESISDFAAQDVDSGSDLETDAATDPEIDREPDSEADSNIDGSIEAPGAWALPDATGVPSVDAAITELARLDELPTSEHVGVYEGLHRQLQDALADLDGS
ncbi:MAG TPA: hypothetical protein VIJ31_13405 [Acidothermaceae bacterium]